MSCGVLDAKIPCLHKTRIQGFDWGGGIGATYRA